MMAVAYLLHSFDLLVAQVPTPVEAQMLFEADALVGDGQSSVPVTARAVISADDSRGAIRVRCLGRRFRFG